MKKTKNKWLSDMVSTAILTAIVILLQVFVSIPLGPFTVTLTLVPIIIGAIMYGPKTGTFLGFVFGVTVAIQVVTGAAGFFSFKMFEMHPALTVVLCILKGAAAGLVSGIVYKLFSKALPNIAAVTLGAVIAPIVNTGIFVAGLFFFYLPLMDEFAAASEFASTVAFIFIGVVGLNFVVEFAINVALIPVIHRLLRVLKITK